MQLSNIADTRRYVSSPFESWRGRKADRRFNLGQALPYRGMRIPDALKRFEMFPARSTRVISDTLLANLTRERNLLPILGFLAISTRQEARLKNLKYLIAD